MQVSFGLHVTFLLSLIRQVMYRQVTIPSASDTYRKASSVNPGLEPSS